MVEAQQQVSDALQQRWGDEMHLIWWPRPPRGEAAQEAEESFSHWSVRLSRQSRTRSQLRNLRGATLGLHREERPPDGSYRVYTCRLSPAHPWGHVSGGLPAMSSWLVLLQGRPELPRGPM